MPETLYLLETRAQRDYPCQACGRVVRKGTAHFRHDPFPAARLHRGLRVTHWCVDCIAQSAPGPKEMVTRRIRVPITRVHPSAPRPEPETQLELWQPIQTALVEISRVLIPRLVGDPSLLHTLTPDQFEEFVCDRLFAMGMEPKRVRHLTGKDGGVDIVFWPRARPSFPFLGAAQVKHHGHPSRREGPGSVRDFAGAIAGHPFNAGLLVTNTSFTPDAQWFARERAKLVRLREFTDLKRWLVSSFGDDAEWREIPPRIELCPGVFVDLGRGDRVRRSLRSSRE